MSLVLWVVHWFWEQHFFVTELVSAQQTIRTGIQKKNWGKSNRSNFNCCGCLFLLSNEILDESSFILLRWLTVIMSRFKYLNFSCFPRSPSLLSYFGLQRHWEFCDNRSMFNLLSMGSLCEWHQLSICSFFPASFV